jgi:hypothetical protein
VSIARPMFATFPPNLGYIRIPGTRRYVNR